MAVPVLVVPDELLELAGALGVETGAGAGAAVVAFGVDAGAGAAAVAFGVEAGAGELLAGLTEVVVEDAACGVASGVAAAEVASGVDAGAAAASVPPPETGAVAAVKLFPTSAAWPI